MLDALSQGYVIYVSMPYVTGLRFNEKRSYEIIELPSKTLEILDSYPMIRGLVEEGRLLQISQEGLGVLAMIGTKIGEEAYGETEAFDIIADALDDCLFTALENLEKTIRQNQGSDLARKKAYRIYDGDRFVRA